MVSNSGDTHQYVTSSSLDTCGKITFLQPDIYAAIEGMDVPHRHTDRWLLSQKEDAQTVFSWFQEVLDASYGVFALSGMVKDKKGNGVEGVIVDAGGVHFATSDKEGNYTITGIMQSQRKVRLAAENVGVECEKVYELEVAANVDDLDFVVSS